MHSVRRAKEVETDLNMRLLSFHPPTLIAMAIVVAVSCRNWQRRRDDDATDEAPANGAIGSRHKRRQWRAWQSGRGCLGWQSFAGPVLHEALRDRLISYFRGQ